MISCVLDITFAVGPVIQLQSKPGLVHLARNLGDSSIFNGQHSLCMLSWWKYMPEGFSDVDWVVTKMSKTPLRLHISITRRSNFVVY